MGEGERAFYVKSNFKDLLTNRTHFLGMCVFSFVSAGDGNCLRLIFLGLITTLWTQRTHCLPPKSLQEKTISQKSTVWVNHTLFSIFQIGELNVLNASYFDAKEQMRFQMVKLSTIRHSEHCWADFQIISSTHQLHVPVLTRFVHCWSLLNWFKLCNIHFIPTQLMKEQNRFELRLDVHSVRI